MLNHKWTVPANLNPVSDIRIEVFNQHPMLHTMSAKQQFVIIKVKPAGQLGIIQYLDWRLSILEIQA